MRMHLRRVPSIKWCQAAVLSLCLEKAFLYHAKKVPMTSSSLHSSQTSVTRRRTTCNYYTHQIGFVNHWTFAPVRINILKCRHFLSDFIYSLMISVYLCRRNVKICIHNFPKKFPIKQKQGSACAKPCFSVLLWTFLLITGWLHGRNTSFLLRCSKHP